jgi:hypothetical protein
MQTLSKDIHRHIWGHFHATVEKLCTRKTGMWN